MAVGGGGSAPVGTCAWEEAHQKSVKINAVRIVSFPLPLHGDQHRRNRAPLAREHIIRTAGGACIHGIGGNAGVLQGFPQGNRQRREPLAASDEANIDRSG